MAGAHAQVARSPPAGPPQKPLSRTRIAATAVQAGYGNVHVDKGLLVGIPAVGGVVLGTWLQQRVPGAVVRLLFAIFLVATAILLVVRA